MRGNLDSTSSDALLALSARHPAAAVLISRSLSTVIACFDPITGSAPSLQGSLSGRSMVIVINDVRLPIDIFLISFIFLSVKNARSDTSLVLLLLLLLGIEVFDELGSAYLATFRLLLGV